MSHSILITGSNRGIGKAIAIKLAEQGFDIILHCRSNIEQAKKVEETIQTYGVQTRILQFDLSKRDACRQVLEEDIQKYGAPYGVVCNAGITRDNAFPALSDTDWDQVLNTNLDGFYNVLKPLLMPMIQTRRGGRIVSLTSVSGLMGNRGQVNYSAAKAGIIGASKALALELAKRKITVNCVAPGIIATDMTENLPQQEILKIVPARRIGTAEEVAGLVAYLCSDAAAYITRQVISINGGMC